MTVRIEGTYRPHHYHFAHRIIPDLFYHQPINFMGTLNFEGKEFLENLWAVAANDRNLLQEDILASEGLTSVELRDYEVNCLANIITLPPAKFQAEAIMVCMLAKVSVNANKKLRAEAQSVFTLEHAGDANGFKAPYVCQWTEDGSHINLGRKHIETADEFFKVCKFNFRPNPKSFFQRLLGL